MIKKFTAIVLLGLGFSTPATAVTQALFPSGKAMVIIQGPPGDMDAPNLFEAMNVPPVDGGNVWKKQASFVSEAGEALFDLTCTLAKNVANYGSCTLRVNGSSSAEIDSQNRSVRFMVGGPDALLIAKSFGLPDQSGSIFLTADKRLGFAFGSNGGQVDSFRISYAE